MGPAGAPGRHGSAKAPEDAGSKVATRSATPPVPARQDRGSGARGVLPVAAAASVATPVFSNAEASSAPSAASNGKD